MNLRERIEARKKRQASFNTSYVRVYHEDPLRLKFLYGLENTESLNDLNIKTSRLKLSVKALLKSASGKFTISSLKTLETGVIFVKGIHGVLDGMYLTTDYLIEFQDFEGIEEFVNNLSVYEDEFKVQIAS